MKMGTVYVPTGQWYIQGPIYGTGGMRICGNGDASSYIIVRKQTPYFMQEQTKVITGTSIVSRNFPGLGQGAGNVLSMTIANHGVPVGHFTSGWVSGLVGTSALYLNCHHLLKATGNNTIELIFPEGAAGTYNVTNASVELDYWAVSFFSDSREAGPGDVFGTVCENLAIIGDASSGGNVGVSGLCIIGAQSSYVKNVRCLDMGGRGALCNVAADNMYCFNSIRGPGYMNTSGPCMENGIIDSEHHNQQALYTLTLSNGNVVPRPEIYLRNATGWKATQTVGEDSPLHMVIDSAVKISVGRFNVNGPGVANRNGFETTMLHIAGDSYENDFSQTHFQGQFKNLVNDQSVSSIIEGTNGIKTNLLQSIRKQATPLSNPILLGPFADDAAAAGKGVTVGAMYNRAGNPTIRTSDNSNTRAFSLANETKGGHHNAATILLRDAIPFARRSPGMTCYIEANGKTYRLDNTLNVWTEDIGNSPPTPPPTAGQIASLIGEGLIAALRRVSGFTVDNAGTAWIAHFCTIAAPIFTIRTTTGYARYILADGTLGAQFGAGNPAANLNNTGIGWGGVLTAHRAMGIMSVDNGGAVRSGDITQFSMLLRNLTTFSGAGLSALTILNLTSNQLTTFSGAGLSALTNLGLSSNQLTTFSGAGLSALTNLTLGFNQLTTFTGAGFGAGLSSIDLSGATNRLETIPSAGLSPLVSLSLIEYPFPVFNASGWGAVERINLSNSQVSSISNAAALTGLAGNTGFNFGLDLQNSQMTAVSLDALFTALPADTGTQGTIRATGCPGSAGCSPAIAEAKGYFVSR